jgi:hypothetical protein
VSWLHPRHCSAYSNPFSLLASLSINRIDS